MIGLPALPCEWSVTIVAVDTNYANYHGAAADCTYHRHYSYNFADRRSALTLADNSLTGF